MARLTQVRLFLFFRINLFYIYIVFLTDFLIRRSYTEF